MLGARSVRASVSALYNSDILWPNTAHDRPRDRPLPVPASFGAPGEATAAKLSCGYQNGHSASRPDQGLPHFRFHIFERGRFDRRVVRV